MSHHAIWRRVRRPFRIPSCQHCQWEVYDAHQAGCLRCGDQHVCLNNSVDNKCPLVLCDDQTRVCNITGFILPEVRHARDEYMENVVMIHPKSNHNNSTTGLLQDIDTEVYNTVSKILLGNKAIHCREQENAKQYNKLTQHMYKQMKLFKTQNPGVSPNVCHILASSMAQEKYWRFIEEASEDLAKQCAWHITLCLLELRGKGVKISAGPRLQDLVCGMLYMLKNGLTYQNRVLLMAIPEVDRCLPHENKIEAYFGISSKVICMTENEVKLVFRECYQN